MIKIDWDYFFYWSKNDLREEIEFELIQGLWQPKRSMYYNRREGAGVQESENLPNGLSMLIDLRFNIVNWIAYRNTQVSDGTDDLPDRRVAVSQAFIDINQDKKGNADVNVLYIPFFDYRQPKNLNVGTGV